MKGCAHIEYEKEWAGEYRTKIYGHWTAVNSWNYCPICGYKLERTYESRSDSND